MNASKDIRYWICSIIALGFMFFFKYVPPIGAITVDGMNIIGIFIGMIVAYCTVGTIWPSILAIILLGLSNGYNIINVFMSAFGHNVVLFMFILLVIGKALEDSGITQTFANWLVSRKIAHNRPWVLSTLIILAAFVCALFIGMIAPALICWTIVTNICTRVGYQKGDAWPTYMIFTIMFLATVASFVFPFQLGVVTNFGILTQVSGGVIVNQFIPYLIFSSILCSLIFAICILAGKYIIKPDVSLLKNNETIEAKLSFDKNQKALLVWFIIFVIGLFLPSILPSSPIQAVLSEMGNTGWSAFMIALGAFIKVDNRELINFNSLASQGVVWDIILMMAAIFTMSAALTAENTGFSTFILNILQPVLNNCSPVLFIVLMVVITWILANLINNIAVCAILVPIAYMVSGNISINILALVTLMNIVGNLGFLLPSSSPQAAMIYNHEWANGKEIKKLALVEMGLAVILTILCLPIAQFIIG